MSLAAESSTTAPPPGGKKIWMAPKLAYRNLFHDSVSLAVTLVGIVFSVLLVAIQCGLYIGSENTIARVLDRVEGDLWIVPFGTKSFDDPSLLPGREKYAALAIPGVKEVEELVIGFASWRRPQGGTKAVLLVGSDWTNGGFAPWNLIEGGLDEILAPGAVAIDKSYFEDLGIGSLGDTAEINRTKIRVAAVTKGVRAFTTLPFIFTTLPRARGFANASQDQASYVVMRLTPEANVETVREALKTRLKDAEILTQAEFRQRSTNYWLFKTGAGMALINGAVLGIIVGVVIVAQTLYASTKDHLNEFATLRALGASAGYIHRVIVTQALMSGVIGYAFGIVMSLLFIWQMKDSTLNVVMTPALAAWLFALTLAMCAIAAMAAIFKVTRIDPAGVFSR